MLEFNRSVPKRDVQGIWGHQIDSATRHEQQFLFGIDHWIERLEGDDGIMDIDEQIQWHVGRSYESFWVDDVGMCLCTPIEYQGQQDFVLLLIEKGFRVNDLVVVDVLFDP